jgi:hypothetical protein
VPLTPLFYKKRALVSPTNIEHWEAQLKVDCFTAATTFLMSSHRTRTSVVFDEVNQFLAHVRAGRPPGIQRGSLGKTRPMNFGVGLQGQPHS